MDGVRLADPGARSALRDRLDQRQRLELRVRLRRLGPDHQAAAPRSFSTPSASRAGRARRRRGRDRGRSRATAAARNSPAGAVPALPVQPRRLRDADRDGAVRGDRVRPGGARADAAPAPAAAARRHPRAADRVGGGARASRSGCSAATCCSASPAHTQPRYLEAFTPAVAIALGCAIPVVVARGSRPVRRLRAARDVRDRDARGRGRDRERQARVPGDRASARCSRCRSSLYVLLALRGQRARRGAGRAGIAPLLARRSACSGRSSRSRRCATCC